MGTVASWEGLRNALPEAHEKLLDLNHCNYEEQKLSSHLSNNNHHFKEATIVQDALHMLSSFTTQFIYHLYSQIKIFD